MRLPGGGFDTMITYLLRFSKSLARLFILLPENISQFAPILRRKSVAKHYGERRIKVIFIFQICWLLQVQGFEELQMMQVDCGRQAD